jgi:hypothetical protein
MSVLSRRRLNPRFNFESRLGFTFIWRTLFGFVCYLGGGKLASAVSIPRSLMMGLAFASLIVFTFIIYWHEKEKWTCGTRP